MKHKISARFVLLLCFFLLAAGGWKSVAFAADAGTEEKQFTGSVEMLKQDNSNYVMQVTVENSGEDFSGTVQVIFQNSNLENCAYNTEIVLPAQGKKQFTVTVPERAVDTLHGFGALNFLSEKEKTIQSITLKNMFGNTMSSIPVGVLSDNYAGLSYLDAGGMDYTIKDMSYPLKMIELSEENLETYLDGIYFLIIDQFNLSSLGEEKILLIQKWVEDGGWLLIGTGAYAEQTLSGFEEDFLDIDVLSISEAGEENAASENARNYGYYDYYYDNAGNDIDFTRMAIAKLDYDIYSDTYDSSQNPALCSTVGEGAVSVFFFSFGEEELQKMDGYKILQIYDETMYRSDSYANFGGYSDMEYIGQRLLSHIDSNNTKVNFKWLEVLIGVYVVLVGPILYLILRKCKKSEWYWIGAPVLGLAFIAGVFFFGQGARVNETRAYSVTVQRTDSNRADTYFLAYHSGTKKWDVRLNSSFEAAGPGWNDYGYRYYGGGGSNLDDYHYFVQSDSEGLSMGLKPQENFESGFFYATGKAESKGNFFCKNIQEFWSGGDMKGIVVNGTGYDLAYMAVWYNSYVMIFSDVKAGEEIDIGQAVLNGRCIYQNDMPDYLDNMMYDLFDLYGSAAKTTYKQDDMAALLIGLGVAKEAKPSDNHNAVVVGIVKDYEKAVADRCNETSYGCFYSYTEMEEN